MKEEFLIKTKELNDYRIKVYYDTDPLCPCTGWDMLGIHLFESDRYLSCNSNYIELFNSSRHTLADAACELACKYVPQNKFIEYINKYCEGLHFCYDRHDRMWYLKQFYKGSLTRESHWVVSQEFTPDEVKGDIRSELSESLDLEDFTYLLTKYQKEIAFYEWSSSGYSQGDYTNGISYCTKERFVKRYGGPEKDWQKRAVEAMESETECIGKWMWGDVLGFVLEKKVRYTKVFADSERSDEECYEWEYVDSCWGFYCSEDELINEVISEHELQTSVA